MQSSIYFKIFRLIVVSVNVSNNHWQRTDRHGAETIESGERASDLCKFRFSSWDVFVNLNVFSRLKPPTHKISNEVGYEINHHNSESRLLVLVRTSPFADLCRFVLSSAITGTTTPIAASCFARSSHLEMTMSRLGVSDHSIRRCIKPQGYVVGIHIFSATFQSKRIKKSSRPFIMIVFAPQDMWILWHNMHIPDGPPA